MPYPTIARLIASHLPPVSGGDAGACYVCGLATEHGQRRPPSDAFTAWGACTRGDVLCPACAATMGCRDVRSFSWLVTPDRFRIAGRGDRGWLWDVLASPPDPPYGLYLTRGGQKQGWISGVRQVATSRVTMPVLTDWTDRPVLLHRADWDAMAPLVLTLREKGLSQRALMSGEFTPNQWKRAITDGYAAELRRAEQHAGDPRWECITYVSNDPNRADGNPEPGTGAGGGDPALVGGLPRGGLESSGR